MRKFARSWFVYLAIGAIVLVFIFWGVGSFRSSHFQTVAAVNGDSISLPTYLKAYNNLLRTYQEKLGPEANEETLKPFNLRGQALNQLIDDLLLNQAAARMGIAVSDAELRDHIQSYPAFRDEKGFDEKRYFTLLARARPPINPTDFENQERQSLLTRKTIQLIASFALVSEADLQELFRLEKEAVAVDYLVVPPAKFLAAQTASEAEIKAYYEAHKDSLREPERAQVRYIFSRFNDYLSEVKLQPEDIESYYQEHNKEFARPKTILLSQLLLEEGAKLTPPQRQQLKSQAEDLLKRAQSGEDFHALVLQYSQDQATRTQGGNLGEVKRGQNQPEWEEVAFSLKQGQIGLARTPKGYYLLKVTEIKETEVPPLAPIKTLVEKLARTQKARQLADQNAKEVKTELSKSSMTEVAARRRLKVRETPYLDAQEPVPDLGAFPPFNQMALSLKPEEISKVLNLSEGWVIMQSLGKKESYIPSLDQIQAKVRLKIQEQKAQEQAGKEAQNLLTRLKKGEPLKKIAAQAGLPLYDSGFFTRPQGFPGLPKAEILTTAAFLLSAQTPYAHDPLVLAGNNYLLVFKARRAPDSQELAQKHDQLYRNLLEQKRQMVFSQWLAAERQRAKIKVYDLPS
jgi:peptidyl-prolyl cis-trans isomerase D